MRDFRLEIPAGVFGTVLPVLTRLRAVPRTPALKGASYVIEANCPPRPCTR
ncbi:hypothetical protein AB0K02_19715 [Streptomyces sp. NPDC049597]|uniref:hypothetical protein n=1 Tax=Streptomyces sp. NPDC049597 TaxID=3155276 RepID=UPI003433969B